MYYSQSKHRSTPKKTRGVGIEVAQKLHEGIAANKLCWQSVQNQQQGAQEPEGRATFRNNIIGCMQQPGCET